MNAAGTAKGAASAVTGAWCGRDLRVCGLTAAGCEVGWDWTDVDGVEFVARLFNEGGGAWVLAVVAVDCCCG